MDPIPIPMGLIPNTFANEAQENAHQATRTNGIGKRSHDASGQEKVWKGPFHIAVSEKAQSAAEEYHDYPAFIVADMDTLPDSVDIFHKEIFGSD
jgi:hypothetical protein